VTAWGFLSLPMLHIVVERWWIRDSFCPAESAWRAVILDPALGITSAADATPWEAIVRAAAHLALKRCGQDEPSQAREDLASLVARARTAMDGAARGRADALTLTAPPVKRRTRSSSRGRRAAKAAERTLP
jgi:hypothetical protein